MSRAKIVALVVSLVVAVGFLLLVFRKPSVFHLLPYSIHQALLRDAIKESTFIDIFDVLFSVGLFFLTMRISTRMKKG